jgi:hypothetical protein
VNLVPHHYMDGRNAVPACRESPDAVPEVVRNESCQNTLVIMDVEVSLP